MSHSRRLANLPPYPFARWANDVAHARQRGLDVIRLDIGNPDMPPPDEVIEMLCRSARLPDRHGYPDYRGVPALREAMAAYYDCRFGVPLDPERQVIPLMGSKEGLINLALATLDPGDLVLVPDPAYAPYTRGAILAGAEVYAFPLLAEHGFLPDLDAIPEDLADRATLIWLNYPNNPTGATADLGFLARAVDFARRHELLLCHDAPYCDVTYDGYEAPSVLQVPGASEVAIEFNSLSKLANMAGWRIGMLVGNDQVVEAVARVKSNVDSGIFRPLQEAAIVALSIDPAWLVKRNAVYRERLGILVNGLQQMGLEASCPQATLYLWAKIPETGGTGALPTRTSEGFARMLLEETGVAVAPGSFFGHAGEGFIRVSATAPTPRIEEARRRLLAFELPRTPTIAQGKTTIVGHNEAGER